MEPCHKNGDLLYVHIYVCLYVHVCISHERKQIHSKRFLTTCSRDHERNASNVNKDILFLHTSDNSKTPPIFQNNDKWNKKKCNIIKNMSQMFISWPTAWKVEVEASYDRRTVCINEVWGCLWQYYDVWVAIIPDVSGVILESSGRSCLNCLEMTDIWDNLTYR